MQEQIAACFIGGAPKAEIVSAAVRPIVSTSVYGTEDGEATLTWSGAAFGLSLRVDLRVEEETQSFRLRPWLLWRKRGTQRFRCLRQNKKPMVVDFAWDLRRARFVAAGDPQPTSGFFVSISAGKMFIVAGDMKEEAYKKAKRSRRSTTPERTTLISRMEHVVFSSSGSVFRTRAQIGGEEKEISMEISGGDKTEAEIRVWIDGETILQVGQLNWKFRGSETVELMSGAAAIHISWDVFRWLFDGKPSGSGGGFSPSELGHAVFVFRIEGEKFEEEEAGGSRKVGRRFGLRKTGSYSSSSSSERSSSIMEWASGEEEELQGSESLSLLISIWRS